MASWIAPTRLLAALHAAFGLGVALFCFRALALGGLVGGVVLVVAGLVVAFGRPVIAARLGVALGAATALVAEVLAVRAFDRGGFLVDEVALARLGGFMLLLCSVATLAQQRSRGAEPTSRWEAARLPLGATRLLAGVHVVLGVALVVAALGLSLASTDEPGNFGLGFALWFAVMPAVFVATPLVVAGSVAMRTRSAARALGCGAFAACWCFGWATAIRAEVGVGGAFPGALRGAQAAAVVLLIAVVVTWARAARVATSAPPSRRT